MKRIFRGCAIGIAVLVVISVIGRAMGGGETSTKSPLPIAAIAPTVTKRANPTPKPTDVPPVAQPTDVVETVIPAAPAALAVGTVNTTANIRDVPRPEASTVLGTVETGATVQLLMKNADATWYGVTTPAGLTGWISASLLTIDDATAGQVKEGTAEDLAVSAPPPPDAPAVEAPAPAEAPVAPAVTPGSDSYPCAIGQIKGNRDSKIYHSPGGASYARTQENVRCFESGAEAEAAGYRAAKR